MFGFPTVQVAYLYNKPIEGQIVCTRVSENTSMFVRPHGGIYVYYPSTGLDLFKSSSCTRLMLIKMCASFPERNQYAYSWRR